MDESVIGAERRGWVVGAQGSWPARPGELRGMRAMLRGWLSPLGLDPVTVDGLVIAAHEAACNAIEHAYPPAIGDDGVECTVDITLRTERGSVVVEIIDHGTWREPAAEPIGRGLGISLMRRLVASILIEKDGRGTRVLLRHPIAASPANLRSIEQPTFKPAERAC